jgi:hypothetical protein
MVNHTTGSAMFTVLEFACGKYIVVTCHTQTLVLLMSHLRLFTRFALCFVHTPVFFPVHTPVADIFFSFCPI